MATLDDHQFQYVEGQGRPGFAALLAQFQHDSDQVARQPGAELDLAYGLKTHKFRLHLNVGFVF